jgi:hypothetical protein
VPRYNPRTGALDTYQVGPFDSTHIYVQWGGKLPGGELWSCGFRMWKASGSTPASATALLGQISTAITQYHGRPDTHIAPVAKLSFVKVNAMDVLGHYQGAGTTQALYADLPGGGTGGAQNANQVAQAVSLTTGFSRGPAHRGRFFNPAPDCLPDVTSGLAPASYAQALANSAKALLTDVNLGGGEQMVIMSRKAGAPGHRAVTGVQVGRVLDTQRRRRGAIPEDYKTAV